MQIYETWFGNSSTMDYEQGLFVADPRSVQYIIISFNLARGRDEVRKLWELHTFLEIVTCLIFIGKRIGLVHVLYAVPILKVAWPFLNYGLLNMFEVYTLSYFLVWFYNAGRNKSCSGSRTNPIFVFLPRTFSCRTSMAYRNKVTLMFFDIFHWPV